MGRFILIRHGETAWNREKRFQGASDTALNEVGRLQAQLVAGALLRENVQSILSSPLLRARETANIIGARLGVEVKVLTELAELAFGEYEGRLESELREKHGERFIQWRESHYTLPAPGGDSILTVKERVGRAVEVMHRTVRLGDVAVVAHQGVLMALKAFLRNDYSVAAAKSFRQSNEEIEIWDPGEKRLVKRLVVAGSYAGLLSAAGAGGR